MSNGWQDKLAGARMQVDQQFNDRIVASEFTNQQWGLIMTAVEFDIENPQDPAQAELVADTDQVEHILPELENMPQGMGGAPMGQQDSGSGGDGVLGKIRGLFGSDGGDDGIDENRLESATALVDEYADELQAFLEEQGRWESLCAGAAGGE
ncbi:hypothetical protein SAMN05216226_103213 [Halovenus aranensis]|uniref:Uncharacterized protein n=1 Tax=Halovenus aranensis TaxID=890420 RepID=A0A1G8TRJ3_9EURY|nr:DUF5799 family protein [Halovenus aranensis]SDJ44206.1 hypothetical protein SAMN05216226_103213 [Halovenus aranensis]